jgi:hypothetical protein
MAIVPPSAAQARFFIFSLQNIFNASGAEKNPEPV